MRYIRKSRQGNRQLSRADKNRRPTSSEEAARRWNRFNKDTLRRQLLNEQYGLCAYSELNIKAFRREHHSPMEGHIEHVEPKSIHPSRTFDYNNLVISALCSEDLSLFSKEDYFGGHAKLNFYDAQRFISPLQRDCRRFFVYLSETGKVEPAPALNVQDTERAHYTIDLLNLNSPYLRNKRKHWLQELENDIDQLLENKPALLKLAAKALCLKKGQLGTFHSASRQVFGALGEQVIQNQCVECD